MDRNKFTANIEKSYPVGARCFLSLQAMINNIPKDYMSNEMGWSNEGRIEARTGSRFLVNAVDTLYEQSFWVEKDDNTLADSECYTQ